MIIKLNRFYIVMLASTVLTGVFSISCLGNHDVSAKISPSLQLQISLRQEQLSGPTPERLSEMQAHGMNTANLNIQRIYIYLKQPLTHSQMSELRGLGITVYSNSWLPPAGNNPSGFILADLPIDKLDVLAAAEFIVSLDTAEKLLKPQSDLPGGK